MTQQEGPSPTRQAYYDLARWGIGAAETPLIRTTWPDLPQERDDLTGWLEAHPDVAEAVTRQNPEGPRPGDTLDPLGKWEVRTLADAYAPRDPLQYAVENLFALPSLSITYGAPGTLKSMLLTDLSICVAGGLPWLSPLPDSEQNTTRKTDQAPVLWLDFDNGQRRTDERVEAMGKARELDPTTPFYYVTMPSPWLDGSDPVSVNDLTQRCLVLDIGLVIIDNLAAVSGTADENKAEMGNVLANFRRLAERTGAAVAIIHHERKGGSNAGRKGDALRGHSSIEANLDLALCVDREEHSDLITIRSTKTRGVDVLPFGAQFAYEWKPDTTELARARFFGVMVEDRTSDRAIDDAIKTTVALDTGIAKTALVNAVKDMLPDIGRARIRSRVDVLAHNKTIVGKRGSHNAMTFALPGRG